ncbi:hypothetical protein FHG87_008395 [Trinorchestia longiramus]|nr:hypothetical protein FHG87_008395 [Trinorchestia longiramus]
MYGCLRLLLLLGLLLTTEKKMVEGKGRGGGGRGGGRGGGGRGGGFGGRTTVGRGGGSRSGGLSGRAGGWRGGLMGYTSRYRAFGAPTRWFYVSSVPFYYVGRGAVPPDRDRKSPPNPWIILLAVVGINNIIVAIFCCLYTTKLDRS